MCMFAESITQIIRVCPDVQLFEQLNNQDVQRFLPTQDELASPLMSHP